MDLLQQIGWILLVALAAIVSLGVLLISAYGVWLLLERLRAQVLTVVRSNAKLRAEAVDARRRAREAHIAAAEQELAFADKELKAKRKQAEAKADLRRFQLNADAEAKELQRDASAKAKGVLSQLAEQLHEAADLRLRLEERLYDLQQRLDQATAAAHEAQARAGRLEAERDSLAQQVADLRAYLSEAQAKANLQGSLMSIAKQMDDLGRAVTAGKS